QAGFVATTALIFSPWLLHTPAAWIFFSQAEDVIRYRNVTGVQTCALPIFVARDEFLAGDNYDVDDVAFNTVKKTLARLSHLSSFPADVNLWMPIEGHPGKIQLVIRNKNEMSQFWNWGELYGDMVPQMETALKTEQRVTVTSKPGWISVLAPVHNSLGDVVGLIEAVSRIKVDVHENVK